MLEGRNLMIVAHTDDETLFAYSQLLNGNWYIVCVTGSFYPERMLEFQQVTRGLVTGYEAWDYQDEWQGTFDEKSLSMRLSDVLRGGFDNILTHNSQGEYGHSQHQSLHQIVSDLVDKNLYVFGENLSLLPFSTLKKKMDSLSLYQTQCQLNAWDWYETGNPDNCLMKYVVYEGLRKVK